MSQVLHLCLPSPMREDAEAGQVNIVNRITAAVAPAGWRVAIHGDRAADRLKATRQGGFALFHMQEPEGPNTLTLRRAYHYPFWQIEATNERWNFDVARAHFDADSVDPDEAGRFFRRWRDRILGAAQIRREGFLFMPLQGRLTENRSFQSMSPVQMIEATLAADPRRPIRATLHPKETYPPSEIAALDRIAARHPRFQVIAGRAEDLLATCDAVVTQNSAVALNGFFAQKPAVLFAGSDFHHIAGSVPREGIERAFARIDAPPPDYARYLTWFFRGHCVNGGDPHAEDQILARLRRHGWPI